MYFSVLCAFSDIILYSLFPSFSLSPSLALPLLLLSPSFFLYLCYFLGRKIRSPFFLPCLLSGSCAFSKTTRHIQRDDDSSRNPGAKLQKPQSIRSCWAACLGSHHFALCIAGSPYKHCSHCPKQNGKSPVATAVPPAAPLPWLSALQSLGPEAGRGPEKQGRWRRPWPQPREPLAWQISGLALATDSAACGLRGVQCRMKQGCT